MYLREYCGQEGDSISMTKLMNKTFDFKIDDVATRENAVEAMTYSELTSFIKKESAKGSPKIPNYKIECTKELLCLLRLMF